MENLRNINPIKVDKTTIINLEKGNRKEKSIISWNEYAGLRIGIECAFLRRDILSAIRFLANDAVRW